MASTHNITKARKDLEKTITESTPLYVVVGAGDLAVARLRDVRADLNARAAKLDPRTAPEQFRALPGRAQSALGEVVATAVTAYGDLAGRGRSLVTRVRSQDETVRFEAQAASAVSRTKAAATTAKQSAAATRTAARRTTTTTKRTAGAATSTVTSSAKGTATTAKKSAARTQTATKSAATSTKKTAKAAKKAAQATASKVGD